MSKGQIIGDLIARFVHGGATVFIAFIVVLSLLKGIIGIVEAQTTDVRIIENDPLLDAHLMTSDIELENALIDIESAIKDIEIMLWDPTTYMQCLDYNTEVYRRAAEAGDTGLELSPQFEGYLKDCWKLTP